MSFHAKTGWNLCHHHWRLQGLPPPSLPKELGRSPQSLPGPDPKQRQVGRHAPHSLPQDRMPPQLEPPGLENGWVAGPQELETKGHPCQHQHLWSLVAFHLSIHINRRRHDLLD